MSRTYPASQESRARFHGRCSFSGLPIEPGDLIRYVADGYDPLTEIYKNRRVVLRGWVKHACYDGQILFDFDLGSVRACCESDEVTLIEKKGQVISSRWRFDAATGEFYQSYFHPSGNGRGNIKSESQFAELLKKTHGVKVTPIITAR